LERQLHAQVAACDHNRVEGKNDRFQVVYRLGLFDLGGDGHPAANAVHDIVHQLDVTRRTNDSATRSTPNRSPNSRSSMSFSDSAGTDTFMPASDRPLLLETGPPSVTLHTTSSDSIPSTTSATLPSSTSRRSPGAASWARFL